MVINCVLLEQQFGNFQSEEYMKKFKNDRSNFGRFYYRFPEGLNTYTTLIILSIMFQSITGESGLDVYNRVTSFIGTLFRWYNTISWCQAASYVW